MKKCLVMLMVALCAILASCHKDKKCCEKHNTIENVDSLINSDFSIVMKSLSDTDSSVIIKFYESDITLNKNMKDTDSIAPVPSVVRNIFQVNDTCWEFTHVNNQKVSIVKYNDYWMEDNAIILDTMINLDSAIALVKKSNIVTPNTKKVCLRQPINPKYKHALYIFGKSVSVDAKTGTVKSFK